MSKFLLIVLASYLLGSIPFGYILVRLFRGEDIRRSGSGNIGATNVARSSRTLGMLTLLLDAGKGYAAVRIAAWLMPTDLYEPRLSQWVALSALLAVTGHVFSVWLRFKGGKGVATGLGAFLCLNPTAVLIVVLVFIALFIAFRRVSLASILAFALFPIADWFSSFHHDLLTTALKVMVCLMIVAKHHENIHRLFAGTEARFSFGSK